MLPSGIQEVVSLSDTPTDVSLPAGFTVATLVVSDVNENYKLTFLLQMLLFWMVVRSYVMTSLRER